MLSRVGAFVHGRRTGMVDLAWLGVSSSKIAISLKVLLLVGLISGDTLTLWLAILPSELSAGVGVLNPDADGEWGWHPLAEKRL